VFLIPVPYECLDIDATAGIEGAARRLGSGLRLSGFGFRLDAAPEFSAVDFGSKYSACGSIAMTDCGVVSRV
jgi:hypothetical protein